MSVEFDQGDVGVTEHVDVPHVDATGVEAIDTALTDLRALASTDVDEHAARYESVHDVLRQTLSRAGDA